ncbi:MAG TPA: ribonuclease HII [Patescibacteria group bacterium]|nr:ribonuclease HII [Patescibacteria group bacterium]
MVCPNFKFEKSIWKNGYRIIAGCDEVGRGSIAGPVVAGCVVYDKSQISGFSSPVLVNKKTDYRNLKTEKPVFINDSKKLTQKQRETARIWIKKHCLVYGIGTASSKVIDKKGIVKATEKAFRRAISSAETKLGKKIEFLLVDAFYIPYIKGIPMARKRYRRGKLSNGEIDFISRQTAIIDGDQKSFSIASASIIAKVFRDSLMVRLSQDPRYKKYGWDKNKGYGSKLHREMILNKGISTHHRKSFCSKLISN